MLWCGGHRIHVEVRQWAQPWSLWAFGPEHRGFVLILLAASCANSGNSDEADAPGAVFTGGLGRSLPDPERGDNAHALQCSQVWAFAEDQAHCAAGYGEVACLWVMGNDPNRDLHWVRPWSTHARPLTRCWNRSPGSFGWLPWRKRKCRRVSSCPRPLSSKLLPRERRPKLRVACLRCQHPSTGRCWARSWRTGRPFVEPSRQGPAPWRRKHVLVAMLALFCAKLDGFVVAAILHVNATTRSSSRWRKCLAKGLVLDLLRPSLLANPRRSDLLSQLSLPGRQWGAQGPHKGRRLRHRQRRRPKQPQLHLQRHCQPWLPVRKKKKLKLRRRTFRFQRHWTLGGPTRSSTGWRQSMARQQRARALSTRTGQGASCGWVESQPGTRSIAFQRELPFRLHAWPKPHHPEEEWCSQMPSWSTCVWPMVVQGTVTLKKSGLCCAIQCMQASRPLSTACQGATEQVLGAVCSEHC